MQAIVLQDPSDPYTLCDVNSAGWHVDTMTYDPKQLQSNRADINLVSNKYPDLNMTMSLALGGELSRIVNIKIMPFEVLGTIFQVPEEIVDV